VSRSEHEMTFAEAFRLGGVVARIRCEPGGTLDYYEVFFSPACDPGRQFEGVPDVYLDDLAKAAFAARLMIEHGHGFLSSIDLAHRLGKLPIEPMKPGDATPPEEGRGEAGQP